MSEQINLEALSQRIAEQVSRERSRRAKGLFIADLMIYVLFMILAWVVLPMGGGLVITDTTLAIMLMLTIGWGIGLVTHGSTVAMSSPQQQSASQDLAITRELLRLVRENDLDKPKCKRGDRLMLSEDGELLEIDTDDDLSQQQTMRR
ncbi:MAG: hypothetical protein K8L99_23275 [Anaerolineae bacterium]|nr:hypothetical protein [Anaerolineae bacterium]